MQENIQIKSISLYNFEQKMFWLLATMIAAVCVLYVCAVVSIVFRVVDRRTAETEIVNETSKIAKLEAEYFALGQKVDLVTAKDLGYTEVAKIDYVSRTPVLTMR